MTRIPDVPTRSRHARREGRPAGFPLAPTALIVLFALLGLDACAAATTVRLEMLSPPGDVRVWPRPPEQPRIRFVAAFSSPRDLGFRRSLLGRVADFFRGRDSSLTMQHPYGIAVGKDESVYVVDSARRGVHVYHLLQGKYSFIDDDDFRNPVGVALGDDGRVFVSDSEAAVVLVFDEGGKRVARISEGLVRPTGIAFHPLNGLLYVVDTGRHEVLGLTADGSIMTRFGGRGSVEGKLNFPTSLAIDAEGLVYVSDALNFRVQVFDENGVPLGGFGQLGDGAGSFARPKGIGVDRASHIYVVEGLYDVVNAFDSGGRHLITIGGPGRGEGSFWLASGLAVDDRDRIFVADTYNGRVQVFQLLGESEP